MIFFDFDLRKTPCSRNEIQKSGQCAKPMAERPLKCSKCRTGGWCGKECFKKAWKVHKLGCVWWNVPLEQGQDAVVATSGPVTSFTRGGYRRPDACSFLFAVPDGAVPDCMPGMGELLGHFNVYDEAKKHSVNSGHCIFRWLALCWTELVIDALSEGLSGERLSRMHSDKAVVNLYDDVLLVMSQLERKLTEDLVTRAVFDEKWRYGQGKVDFLKIVQKCFQENNTLGEKLVSQIHLGVFISVPEVPKVGLVSKFQNTKGNVEVFIRFEYLLESYRDLIRALRPWTTCNARSLLSAARRSQQEEEQQATFMCQPVFLTLCIQRLPATVLLNVASFAFPTCKGQKRGAWYCSEKTCLSKKELKKSATAERKIQILLECLVGKKSDLCSRCSNLCELCSKPTRNPRLYLACNHACEMRLCSGCVVNIPNHSGRKQNGFPYKSYYPQDALDQPDSDDEQDVAFCRPCLEDGCFAELNDGIDFPVQDGEDSDGEDVTGEKVEADKFKLVDRLGYCFICQRIGSSWSRCNDCLVNMCNRCCDMTMGTNPTLPHYHACSRCDHVPPQVSFHAMRAIVEQIGYTEYKYKETRCDGNKRPCDNPDCQALGSEGMMSPDWDEVGGFWSHWRDWQFLPFSPPIKDKTGFEFHPTIKFNMKRGGD